MKVYVSLVHLNNHVITAIMNPDVKDRPLIAVNDSVVTGSAWIRNHRQWTGLTAPRLNNLLWLNAVELNVRRKCWIRTELWSHSWGRDNWIHVVHDDGELCNKNDEHFLNGRKMDLVGIERWQVATGYFDYLERIESGIAKGEGTWVLTENMVLKPAAKHSFA